MSKSEIICGIYKITSPSNKIYIGKSTNILQRWGQYKRLRCKSQVKLYYSLLKYGYNSHLFEIIQICKESELNSLEIYYSEIYDCLNPKKGLNLIAGGIGGRQSEEVKKKISQSNKGRKFSEEHRKAISKSAMGRTPWNLGKPHSKETKGKIGKANTGKKSFLGKSHTEETKEKIRVARTGKTASFETKEKLKEANGGSRNGMFGKKHSEETKQKMRESRLIFLINSRSHDN